MAKHPKIPKWNNRRPTEPGWYWLNKGKGTEMVYAMTHPYPEEPGELVFIEMGWNNPIRQHAMAFLGWDWLLLETVPVIPKPKPRVKRGKGVK